MKILIKKESKNIYNFLFIETQNSLFKNKKQYDIVYVKKKKKPLPSVGLVKGYIFKKKKKTLLN